MFLQSLTAKLIGVVIAGVSVAFYLNGTMELMNAVVMVIAAFILFGALDSAGSYSALLRNVDLNVSKAQSVLDMPTMDIDGRDITPTNYDIDVENVEFVLLRQAQRSSTAFPCLFRRKPPPPSSALRWRQDHPLSPHRPVLGCGQGLSPLGRHECEKITAWTA